MHLRWQSIDDSFIWKPDGFGGGKGHERAGCFDFAGLIDPEYREFVRP
jgi:hypothetical protein